MITLTAKRLAKKRRGSTTDLFSPGGDSSFGGSPDIFSTPLKTPKTTGRTYKYNVFNNSTFTPTSAQGAVGGKPPDYWGGARPKIPKLDRTDNNATMNLFNQLTSEDYLKWELGPDAGEQTHRKLLEEEARQIEDRMKQNMAAVKDIGIGFYNQQVNDLNNVLTPQKISTVMMDPDIEAMKEVPYAGPGIWTRGWNNLKSWGAAITGKAKGSYDFVVNAPENAKGWARKKAKETQDAVADYAGQKVKEATDNVILKSKTMVGDAIADTGDRIMGGFDGLLNGQDDDDATKILGKSDDEILAKTSDHKWRNLSTAQKAKKGSEIAGYTLGASLLFADLLPGVAQVISATKEPPDPDTYVTYVSPDAPNYTIAGGAPYVPSSTVPASSTAQYSAQPEPDVTEEDLSIVEETEEDIKNKSGAGSKKSSKKINSKKGYGISLGDAAEMLGGFINYQNTKYVIPTIRSRLNKSGEGISLQSLLDQTGLHPR